ncbi:hypothetical protein IQ230_13920 [Gloeocapsopsis crepidinum LEGE 06123]|uniref:Uncharacterized protein n=1 Tax=Gloeocapsopsis crepidinum LEGE 06123 TaxID=588587 RepID=A0ABR9UT39_9CHRO|nr:hypothetical protein [Gloeocapsopsis crepidinum]MBE9191424.1 hypothetical protein [Gloeocapsopsis crepidinum LEGE 06123]
MELLLVALCLSILALSAVGILIAAIRVMRPSVRLVQTYQRPRSSRQRSNKKQPVRLHHKSADRQLQSKLFSMTMDRATALRLIEGLRELEPGRPENWYWEKAIDDLIRDRRR